ncbi:Sodium-driven chloride bicarbonate exchanger [Chelonia mydas]|uniref:Sodium-driven chloride bicarbonate exchanger n=1 Tax=Chelonia mydas TaxID=8469 RepID=M7BNB7_CHEMY|nr:Sodium-driven chloride bicarbonate exchanger [Chelonia mydas]
MVEHLPGMWDSHRNDEEAVVDRGGTRSILKTHFEKEDLEALSPQLPLARNQPVGAVRVALVGTDSAQRHTVPHPKEHAEMCQQPAASGSGMGPRHAGSQPA